MTLRLGEINLYVRNLDRAADFYARALGFEPYEQSEPPGVWVKLKRDAVTLLFWRAAEGAEPCRVGAAWGMSADLLVDEFDATVQALEAAGAAIEPPRTENGWRYTVFRDPDGIRWELIASARSG